MDIKYCGPGHYFGISSPKDWIKNLIHKYKKVENNILEESEVSGIRALDGAEVLPSDASHPGVRDSCELTCDQTTTERARRG